MQPLIPMISWLLLFVAPTTGSSCPSGWDACEFCCHGLCEFMPKLATYGEMNAEKDMKDIDDALSLIVLIVLMLMLILLLLMWSHYGWTLWHILWSYYNERWYWFLGGKPVVIGAPKKRKEKVIVVDEEHAPKKKKKGKKRKEADEEKEPEPATEADQSVMTEATNVTTEVESQKEKPVVKKKKKKKKKGAKSKMAERTETGSSEPEDPTSCSQYTEKDGYTTA